MKLSLKTPLNSNQIFYGMELEHIKVFFIQKKIIRLMAGTKKGASCRELFKKFNILLLASKFLLSLLSSVVKHRKILNKLRYPQCKYKKQI
jgi:hypothetical protein